MMSYLMTDDFGINEVANIAHGSVTTDHLVDIDINRFVTVTIEGAHTLCLFVSTTRSHGVGIKHQLRLTIIAAYFLKFLGPEVLGAGQKL